MTSTYQSGKRHVLRRLLVVLLLALVLFIAAFVVPVLVDLEQPGPPASRNVGNVDWVLPALPQSDRHALLLMIDGLAVEPFQRALDAGGMPHLAALLETRPTSSMVAISTFPSSTSPSVPELLSGRYVELESLPAPPAVHAFDREERTVIRYVTEPDEWQWPVPTLFDALRGRSAVTVFEGRWDGPVSILTQYNMIGQALLEKIGAAALSGGDRGPVEAYLELIRKGAAPVVSLVVLNEFDMSAHFHGPESEQVQRALTRADELIGEIVDALAELPATGSSRGPPNPGQATTITGNGSLLEQTVVVLFGDHGMAQSGRYVDLAEFFSNKGLSAVDVSTIPHVLFRERLGTLWTNWTDVILVAGGSNITQVYLNDPEHGWGVPPADATARPDASIERDPGAADGRKRDLARPLTAVEGVDQVMWRGADGAVHVLGPSTQEVRILTRGTGKERRHAYVVDSMERADPLRYLDLPATRALTCAGTPGDGCFHSTTAWLDASASSEYPGAVGLLTQAFLPAKFSGDLMVAARIGYTFLRGQQGDHGNLHRASMLTPLVINGPGVSACSESHQPRLVDIYPSVAVLLGARADDPAFAPLDGRVLDCVAGTAELNSPQASGSDGTSLQ